MHTALHYACQSGHAKVVEALLKANVNLNVLTIKVSIPLLLPRFNHTVA